MTRPASVFSLPRPRRPAAQLRQPHRAADRPLRRAGSHSRACRPRPGHCAGRRHEGVIQPGGAAGAAARPGRHHLRLHHRATSQARPSISAFWPGNSVPACGTGRSGAVQRQHVGAVVLRQPGAAQPLAEVAGIEQRMPLGPASVGIGVLGRPTSVKATPCQRPVTPSCSGEWSSNSSALSPMRRSASPSRTSVERQ